MEIWFYQKGNNKSFLWLNYFIHSRIKSKLYFLNNDFNIITKIYLCLYCFYNIWNIYYELLKIMNY